MSAANFSPRIVGRYALYGEIASGGMATVYLGRLLGQVGFSRTVAIKCLHPQFAKDPDFMSMFLDEARLAARIQHPNAVQTLDVVATEADLFLVMEYLQGESLSRLIKASSAKGQAIPLEIVTSIICGMLHGLHAVHEARDEHGAPLGIVHRDVSPQNVLVGVDGVARVLDFGVAKAAGRIQTTREGQLKGKLSYMAPEQVRGGQAITRQTDIYSATVVLWEALTGRRLREGENEAQILGRVLDEDIPALSQYVPNLPRTVDNLIARGAHRDPKFRFSSAREMALALEACIRPATATEVGAWVEHLAYQKLTKRAQQVAELESSSAVKVPIRLSGDQQNPGYDISAHPMHESGPGSSPGSPGAYPGTNPNLQPAQWPSPGGSGPYLHHSMPAPSGISQVSQVSQPSQPSYPSHASQSHPSSVMYQQLQQQQQQQQQSPQKLGWIMVLLGVATAALVVSSLCAMLLLRKSPQSHGADLAHATAPVSSPPVSPSATPSATPPVTIDAPPAASATVPTIAASALPTSPSTATAAPHVATTGGATSKPKSSKADCDPPYTRDASGVKTYKLECMK